MDRSERLAGMRAVVTGAGRGIGLGIAKSLAAEGCNIVVCDIHEPAAVAEAMVGLSDNPIMILLLINLVLLMVGIFMDMTPAVLIFTPIFLPVAVGLGLDPVDRAALIADITPDIEVGLGLARRLVVGDGPVAGVEQDRERQGRERQYRLPPAPPPGRRGPARSTPAARPRSRCTRPARGPASWARASPAPARWRADRA